MAQEANSDSVSHIDYHYTEPSGESEMFLSPKSAQWASAEASSSLGSEIKEPGRFQRLVEWVPVGPIVGIIALGLTVSSAFFSLAILIASNGQPIDSWSIQPTVYIAIASAVANTAISVAYYRAVPIAWWYRASRGATIRTLERQWEASSSLPLALLHARDTGFTTAVAVLMVLMIVDGPLLQRAASVRVATTAETISLNLSVSPEVPTGFSGYETENEFIQSTVASRVGQDWQKGRPIMLPTTPLCKGTCLGKILGPGLTPTKCNHTSWPISDAMYYNPNATWGPQGFRVTVDTPFENGENSWYPAFVSEMMPSNWPPNSSEAAYLYQGTLELINGSGSYTSTACNWSPAILEYRVQFDSANHVTLLQDPTLVEPVVSLANNTRLWNPDDVTTSVPVTIDFFTYYLGPFIFANASAWPPLSNASGGFGWTYDTTTFNAQAMKYLDLDVSAFDTVFDDPTPDTIHSFNEILFRAAVVTAGWPNLTSLIDPGLTPHQTTLANQTVTQNVFHSDFRWYAAATALEILVVMAVVPMFWGCWSLDTHLDLSPFGLALAFNAPLVDGADFSKGAAGVVKDYGRFRVRYSGPAADSKASADSEGKSRIRSGGFVLVGSGEGSSDS